MQPASISEGGVTTPCRNGTTASPLDRWSCTRVPSDCRLIQIPQGRIAVGDKVEARRLEFHWDKAGQAQSGQAAWARLWCSMDKCIVPAYQTSWDLGNMGALRG